MRSATECTACCHQLKLLFQDCLKPWQGCLLTPEHVLQDTYVIRRKMLISITVSTRTQDIPSWTLDTVAAAARVMGSASGVCRANYKVCSNHASPSITHRLLHYIVTAACTQPRALVCTGRNCHVGRRVFWTCSCETFFSLSIVHNTASIADLDTCKDVRSCD